MSKTVSLILAAVAAGLAAVQLQAPLGRTWHSIFAGVLAAIAVLTPTATSYVGGSSSEFNTPGGADEQR